MIIRLATHADIASLTAMRSDFTREDNAALEITDELDERYRHEMRGFLENALESDGGG